MGLIEAGMSFAEMTNIAHRLPEAYVGAVDGHEGVKLEEQVVVTHNGVVPLSSYRYEAAMLA
jgi:Xaa-Pro aminopeptidase